MSFPATVLRVMIASPSDCEEERATVRVAVHEWNSEHSQAHKVVLLPRMWELESVPEMSGPPQDSIDRQLGDDCDLLVAIFKASAGGSATKKSGTLTEIEHAADAGLKPMIYFPSANAKINMGSVDPDELARLLALKSDLQGKALLGEYDSADHLGLRVSKDLLARVREMMGDGSVEPPVTRAEVGQQAQRIFDQGMRSF
jgi:hypothetical protein